MKILIGFEPNDDGRRVGNRVEIIDPDGMGGRLLDGDAFLRTFAALYTFARVHEAPACLDERVRVWFEPGVMDRAISRIIGEAKR